MELDLEMLVEYTVHVNYVDDTYMGDSKYTGTILFEEIGPDAEEFYHDYLMDQYCFKLNLEPDQIEISFYIDEEILMEKEAHLKEWEEWKLKNEKQTS